MSSIRKIIGTYKLGGIKLLLYKYMDDHLGKDKVFDYVYDISRNAPESEHKRLLSAIYEMKTGNKIDIDRPVTFNEKIQWLKIYDSTEIKTKLADKYIARDYVKQKIGEQYLIPLLGVWNSFDEIDFDSLPDKFVLKTNHGSGSNIVVSDKKKLDISEAREKFNTWMKTNYAYCDGFELHYKDIEPKIIAEKFIGDDSGLIDYRFYCFNGKAEQVWVDKYSGTPQHIRSVYDMNWNKIGLKCCWPDGGEELSRKPLNYDLMLESATRLSEGFFFVRVDFYEDKGHMYMGELTFTPLSGFVDIEPKEYDRLMGDLMKLPL